MTKPATKYGWGAALRASYWWLRERIISRSCIWVQELRGGVDHRRRNVAGDECRYFLRGRGGTRQIFATALSKLSRPTGSWTGWRRLLCPVFRGVCCLDLAILIPVCTVSVHSVVFRPLFKELPVQVNESITVDTTIFLPEYISIKNLPVEISLEFWIERIRDIPLFLALHSFWNIELERDRGSILGICTQYRGRHKDDQRLWIGSSRVYNCERSFTHIKGGRSPNIFDGVKNDIGIFGIVPAYVYRHKPSASLFYGQSLRRFDCISRNIQLAGCYDHHNSRKERDGYSKSNFNFIRKANFFPFPSENIQSRLIGFLFWIIGGMCIAAGFFRIVTAFFRHYVWSGILLWAFGLVLIAVGCHFIWPPI